MVRTSLAKLLGIFLYVSSTRWCEAAVLNIERSMDVRDTDVQNLAPKYPETLPTKDRKNSVSDYSDAVIAVDDYNFNQDVFSLDSVGILRQKLDTPSLRGIDDMGRFYYCGSITKNNCNTSCKAFGYPLVQCGRKSCYCTY